MNLYGRDGQPISLTEWTALSADDAYRRIGDDSIGERRVSTVWLGTINPGFSSDERATIQASGLSDLLAMMARRGSAPEAGPLIFESMVFDGDQSVETVRYATEHDAREGHAELVTLLRATHGDEQP